MQVGMIHTTRTLFLVVFAVRACLLAGTARADEVTDWNQIMFQAAVLEKTSPLVMTRVAAIVQASVFDAVNGIERRYTPIHLKPAAPRGASRRAAVVQAAYASLIKIYPNETAIFDAARAASLASILKGGGKDRARSVAAGIQWGQTVADAIWVWRSTDGFAPPPPPFLGGTDVGMWRPTPPAFAPGAGPQFAYMTPWVIQSPSQFRPTGPPALNSVLYAEVFNETKTMGSLSSSLRSAEQTLFSLFWNASPASFYWDRITILIGAKHHATLSQNARLLAAVNIAMADAAIACWEAKYHYVFWRPVTAIPLADSDGNLATAADPNWVPLSATPAHPEYPSAHSTVSSAAATVLAHYFGEDTAFSVDSDVMLGVIRSFPSFSAALTEIRNARIFAGIHFRSACDDGQVVGTAVGKYVLANAFRQVERESD
jgi:membrane-associated phospholipid phosphatase